MIAPRWQQRACPTPGCEIDEVLVRPRADLGEAWEIVRGPGASPWHVASDAPLCVLCGAVLRPSAAVEREATREALGVGA